MSTLYYLISERRERTFQSVNSKSIFLNWDLSEKIDYAVWGSITVRNIADYIKEKYPGLKGFDCQTLSWMVHFYRAYISFQFVGSLNRQIESNLQPNSLIVGSWKLQLMNSILFFGKRSFVKGFLYGSLEDPVQLSEYSYAK